MIKYMYNDSEYISTKAIIFQRIVLSLVSTSHFCNTFVIFVIYVRIVFSI